MCVNWNAMFRLSFSIVFLFVWTLCEIIVIKNQKDKIYNCHVILEVYLPMWSVCAQLCSRMQICKSINFIAWNNTCQINNAEPEVNLNGLLKSVGNSFVAASTLPKIELKVLKEKGNISSITLHYQNGDIIIIHELAGPCKDHDCKVSEVCIPQTPNYICVPLLEIFDERGTREGSLVSQFKKTGQSTPYSCSKTLVCEAEAGVDGIKAPNNMFHTGGELEPFWWVNLGEVYEVQKVVSTNRINCCGHKLSKMLVHVGENLDTCRMELCGTFIGPGVTGQVIVTPCITFPKGQMVKLTSVNAEPGAFHLAEVEVYGAK